MKNTNQPTNAVAYLRVSGLSQVEGDGFARQSESIDRACIAHGFVIVATFMDAGVSGEVESANRTGFSDLVAYCQSNGVDTLIVERSDRLARNLMVSEVLIARAQEIGLRVIDASSGTNLCDASDPTRVMIRQVLGCVAQYQKSELVSKLAIARARKRASGQRCDGRKPFAHSDEIEVRTLSVIRNMKGEGRSLRSIAGHLNATNQPTRQGRPWQHSSVASVIRNGAVFASCK